MLITMYKLNGNNFGQEYPYEYTPVDKMLIGVLLGAIIGLVINILVNGIHDNKYVVLRKEYADLTTAHGALLEMLDSVEKKNARDVEDYNKLVDEHNALVDENEALRKKNESDMADYNALVEQYNQSHEGHCKDVDDYNDLAERFNQLLEEKDSAETRVARLESRLSRVLDYKE